MSLKVGRNLIKLGAMTIGLLVEIPKGIKNSGNKLKEM
jgi:hypothetical protein